MFKSVCLLACLALVSAQDPANGWMAYAVGALPAKYTRITKLEMTWKVGADARRSSAFYSPWFGMDPADNLNLIQPVNPWSGGAWSMYTEYFQWSPEHNSNSRQQDVKAGQTLHGSLEYIASSDSYTLTQKVVETGATSTQVVKCQSGKKYTVPYVVYEKAFPCRDYPADEVVSFNIDTAECDGADCMADIAWTAKNEDNKHCDMMAHIGSDNKQINITWSTTATSDLDDLSEAELFDLNYNGWATALNLTRPAEGAEASFRTFLATYNKEYKNATEFAYRLEVFKKNLQIAEQRNADGEAVHGITKFSDLTNEEFRSFYLGYKAPTGARQELDIALTDSSEAASVDWRGHSPAILTPVKNQAQCGSCWAFSATEQIETNYAMAGNAIPSLSVQQIVSCDKVDEGCNGGNTETAYAYVEKAGGLETEASYPYTSGKGKDGKCKDKKAKEVVAIKGFNTISKTEASEKKMVTQMGDSPISVCVDATKWQTYKKGILGRTCGKQLDHCVQAVGLNTDGAKPYWIVRNSWASDWGVDGYIYVEEGINACGIAKDATTVNI